MTRILFLLLCLSAAGPAAAATVYKCTDGKELVAYQATPCAAHLVSRRITIAPAPRPAAAAVSSAAPAKPRASRDKAATPRRAAAPRRARAARTVAPAPDQSWECRIGNGEVFYQHSPCPAAAVASHTQRDKATRGRSRSAAQLTPISGRPLPRAEACRRIHAPSASGRAGHERDEDVSSYERSLGRDPCR